MVVRENAEELARMAEEIGADVIWGRVSYAGGVEGILWKVGDMDMGGLLTALEHLEVVLIVAPIDIPDKPPLLASSTGAEE